MTDPYAGLTNVPGIIYLLHFSRPFKHARHYLGWAGEGRLEQRLEHHKRGTGAVLLRHVAAAGITWELARTWEGDRFRERSLKAQGGRSRMCPICIPALGVRLGRVLVPDHSLPGYEHPDLRLAGLCEPVPDGPGALDGRVEGLHQPLRQDLAVPLPL